VDPARGGEIGVKEIYIRILDDMGLDKVRRGEDMGGNRAKQGSFGIA
jgi:hypothetical protein